ncbi:nucleic acid-binding, OB-fold protein [Artemisia annua]|uniref:Nucleic acid-binding, OB-fold protein n=1 Tax=Artemisia annua TaxID=35608 RepID=A0A2U1P1K9_ARTAN|nr:nucleic acid-binding, OB-fold protein [Artemisia annua]
MALTGDADTSLRVAVPAIPQRSLAYFTDLNTADNSKFIEARVYRKWTAMIVPSLIPTGFSCILLDKKGSAIQANADLQEKERFERDLQTNCVYRIQGFGFEKTDSWGKTLDNDITLCFGKHTQIDLLKDDEYPTHYFNFAAYNELGGRLEKKNPILTDYIGYVHNVEKIKEYGGATGNKIKLRNIGIRNLNNNVVVFTLWNEKADNFNEEEIQGFGFEKTDSWGKTLDNDITLCFGKHTQIDLLKDDEYPTHYFNFAAYNELGGRLEKKNPILTDYIGYVHNVEKIKEYGGATGNKIKLRNIGIRNLNNNVVVFTLWNEKADNFNEEEYAHMQHPVILARVLLTQDVMILRIDTTQDWYYQKCDECGGKLRYGFIHGQCHQYGTQLNPQKSYSFRIIVTDGTGNATITCFSPQTEGLIKDVNTLVEEVANKDPQVIPPEILALQNTRHVLQFRFAKPAGKGPPTFVLQKVMDHQPAILPAPSEGPSSPPITATDTETTTEVSPPPATPIATQDTPANTADTTRLPSSTTVRKELFSESAEQESGPELKKQKID